MYEKTQPASLDKQIRNSLLPMSNRHMATD